MITEALRLLITADAQGAVRGIEQVGKAADRNLSRSEKQMERWGNRLTSIGSGLIAFGAVAAYGLGQAAQSASDLGEAVNASEVVFGDAIGTIDKYAKTSAKSMGLSERAFRQALVPIGAMLKNVGLSEQEAADESVKLAQRAADMASVFNTDVGTALEAIQAGLRGEADPLERFGVGLTEAAVNAKAVALGLADSTTSVDAAAKAQARLALIYEQTNEFAGDFTNTSDSMANRQRILAAEFENLKASIGEGVIPVMEVLFDLASKGVNAFSGLNTATGGFVGQAATVTTVAALAAGGLSLLVGQALKMHQTFSTARTAVSEFAGAGGLGRLGRTLVRGGLVIGGLYLLEAALDAALGDQAPDGANLGKLQADLVRFGQSGHLTGEAVNVLGNNFEGLKGALEDVDLSGVENARASVDRFASSIPGAGRLLSTGFAGGVDESKRALEDFDQALASIAATSPEAAFEILSDAAEAAGVKVDDILPHLDEYQSQTGQIEASAALAGGEVDEFGRSMDGAAGSTEGATSALEEYNTALKSLFDPLFGAVSAQNSLRDANQDVIDKTAALVEAEAQYGAGSAEAAAAALALSDAQFGASQAALDQEGALLTLKDAVDNGTVSVSAARAKLAEWVAQGWITQASADATAAAFDGAAWSMGAIPDGKTIVIGIDGAAPVIGQLDAIARRVNALAGGSFRVSVGGGGGLTMHTGGIVPGPRGQEVAAVLQAGEGVISIPEMDKLASGAGAGGLSQDVRMSAGVIARQIVSLDGTVRYVGNVINRTIAHATNLITGKGPRAENWANPISEYGKQAYLAMYGSGPLAAVSSAGSTGGGKVDVGLHITGTGGLAKVIHEEVRGGNIQLTVNGQRVRAA